MKKITKTKSVQRIEKPTKQVVRIIKLPNKGEAGYTPVKDKDYFDGKTPVKGVDYKDGENGYTPQKGVDYNDGENGYTPIKGKDYFDGKPGKQGPRGPAGKSFPKEEVKKMVDKSIAKKLPELMDELEGKGQVGVEQMRDGYNLIINGKKHFVPNAVYGPKLRNFIQLGDSPGTYAGAAGKFIKVNATETGLEYGTASGGGSVESVTGLNVDNTDPANPIMRISVDGVTVTGLGTPASPLVAVGDGTGDVHGPASSTDNAIARFDSTTGKIIQNSGITIADGATGTLSGTNTGDQDLSGLVPYTGATGDVTLGVHGLTLHDIKGDASDGLLIESNNGTDIAILGAGNTANGTWYGSHNIEGTQVAIGKSATTLGKLKLYGNTSGDVTIQPNAVAGTGVVLTAPATTGTIALTSNITGTNSGTNTGDQTITNSSDATSHTVTLSASGGSVQLIEGSNITLTTGGTGSAGTVTIAATAGGTGDVVGPASATDNAIARFDSTTGKLIQNSAATIADTTGDITAGKYNTVAISGASTPTLAVTGSSSISGANTGDQTSVSGNAGTATALQTARTIGTATGDVTSAGSSFDGSANNTNALTIANSAVTLAKMANLAQDQFIGRTTASTGVPETATITAAARTVLDDTTVGAMVDTLGGATSTGTGGIARATSPTFVTPALGTPSALVATNATGTASGLTAGDSTKIGGITVTGTPAVGYVPTATSTSAATWQAPSGGGNPGWDFVSYTTASAASSITVSSLNINTDGGMYQVIVKAEGSTVCDYTMQLNAVTTLYAWGINKNRFDGSSWTMNTTANSASSAGFELAGASTNIKSLSATINVSEVLKFDGTNTNMAVDWVANGTGTSGSNDAMETNRGSGMNANVPTTLTSIKFLASAGTQNWKVWVFKAAVS